MIQGEVSESSWYYADDGASVGPFKWRRLEALYEKGLIVANTYVWQEGTEGWKKYGQVLSERRSAIPPVPETLGPRPPPLPSKSSTQLDSDPRPPESRPDVQLDGINVEPTPAAPLVSTLAGPMSLQEYVHPVEAGEWKVLPVTPWRRYAARTLDTTLHGSIAFFLIGLGLYSVAPLSADRFLSVLETSAGGVLNYVLSSLLAVPIGALLLGMSGSTLGKFLFGVRVHTVENSPIGVVRALQREIYVWFAGLGLGIPIVTIFCLLGAKRRLERTGFTSWDQGNSYVVTHRPSGPKQIMLNVLGIAAFSGLVALLYLL